MNFIQKHKKLAISLASLVFIFHLFVTTSLFTRQELMKYFFMIVFFYMLILFEVYQIGKMRRAISAAWHVSVLAVSILLFTVVPVVLAGMLGMLPVDISVVKAVEINLVFALCIAAIYYISRNLHAGFAKVVLLVIVNIVFLVNCFFVALLYSTGFEFSPTVFLHIDATAIKVAAEQYVWVLVLLGLLVLPISYVFYRMVHHQEKDKLSLGVASLSLLALAANAIALNVKGYDVSSTVPSYSLLDAWVKFNKTDYDDKWKFYHGINYTEHEKKALSSLGIRTVFSPDKLSTNDKKYNLILVYLESYQNNFTRRGGWPEKPLTPVLDSLEGKYSIFDNFYNSASPTINAVVSSQCGADLEIGDNVTLSNSLLQGHDRKMKALFENKLFCMPDYLKKAGYMQVFMKGASMDFSGKGNFLHAHGYDEAIGFEELNTYGKYTEKSNQWGVPDPALFRESAKKLELLRKENRPFSMNILTVNAHPPGYEDSECPVYKEGNHLLNGVFCTDYSLAWFLKFLEENDYYKDTVVVMMGDHVMFPSKVNSDSLAMLPKLSWYGNTYFAVHEPDGRLPKHVSTIGYTPDLAATVMDLLGFGEVSFSDGRSLLASRRDYQHLVSKKYEILDGKMSPEAIGNQLLKCSLEQLNEATIELDGSPLTDCQREKIYYAKHLFLYN